MADNPSDDKESLYKETAKNLVENEEFKEKLIPLLVPRLIPLLVPKLKSEKALSEKVAQELAHTDDFTNRTVTSQFRSEVAKHLSKEKRMWVILSLVLAIFSFLIMGVVYGLNLFQGGADAIKTFALPIIGAFCLVVLAINVAFNLMVFKVTR